MHCPTSGSVLNTLTEGRFSYFLCTLSHPSVRQQQINRYLVGGWCGFCWAVPVFRFQRITWRHCTSVRLLELEQQWHNRISHTNIFLSGEHNNRPATCFCCTQNLRRNSTTSGTSSHKYIRSTMLEAGRSRVRDPMRWMNFFNLPNPSNRTKWVPEAEK
jgi:hypothetical protein